MRAEADADVGKTIDMQSEPPAGLCGLLREVRRAAEGETVSFAMLIEKAGRKSFSAVLLLIGLLIVSPLSGIPGLPAIFAVVAIIIVVQALFQRSTLWLPRRIMDMSVRTPRLNNALDRLEPGAHWLDSHTGERFSLLVQQPLSSLAYIVIMMVTLTWPPLSLIPFSATLTAIGITLLASGLMLRDGLFIIFGYAYLTFLYGGGALLLMGIF